MNSVGGRHAPPALNGESFPLFRNAGGGSFEDVTAATGIRALSLPLAGFGLGIYDFDNDGWKDLFVACGEVEALVHAGNPVAQPNAVFRNPGKRGRWTLATIEAGFGALAPARHRGAAFGDLNGDGRIDAVVTALDADGEIWLNASANQNHWLELSLAGTKSNRDGIGAHLKLVSKSGAQYNHVHQRRICFFERRPSAFRSRTGHDRGFERDPLAFRCDPAAYQCESG
ncbi:MAG TPA: VCBS repeat-containing protein [Bryobacteraceae bacterium]|jgi:hypothetical protein|nr:VCBS repeat-containing protein [Bryobacteraceae bacterium]